MIFALLSFSRIVKLQQCGLAKYWDPTSSQCLKCDSSCGDFCLGPSAGDCILCSESQIKSGLGLRVFYASQKSRVYLQGQENQILSSWECQSTCPEGTLSCETWVPQINSTFKYCREPVYFVDPSSRNSNIELGTLEYPFKGLDDPFRELFNNADGQFREVAIYVKWGSNLTIHSVEQPLIAFNINLTIKPYYDDNQQDFTADFESEKFKAKNFTKISIYNKQYWRPLSDFNPSIYSSRKSSSLYSYDFELKAQIQNIFPSNWVSPAKLKFVTYNANIRVQYLHFDEVTFVDSSTNALFVPNQTPQRWINISSCYFTLKQMHFFAQDGGNIKLENSIIDITYQSRIVQYQASTDCALFLSPGSANNLLFINNTFVGQSQSGYTALIYGQNHLNFTMKGNRFNNFSWVDSGVSVIINNFQISCSFKPVTQILIQDNVISNSLVQRFSNVYFSLSLDANGQQRVLIENNTFQSVFYGNQDIFNIQRPKSQSSEDIQLIIKNITFNQMRNIVTASNLITVNAQEFSLSDVQIIDSNISSGLILQAQDKSLISNIKFVNVQNGGLITSSSLLRVIDSRQVYIQNISYMQVQFRQLSGLFLYQATNLEIRNLSFNNSTFESQNLIEIFDIKNASFSDVLIQDVKDKSMMPLSNPSLSVIPDLSQQSDSCAFSFKSINSFYNGDSQHLNITNLMQKNSQIALLNVQGVSSSQDSDGIVTLKLSNASLLSNNLLGKQSFISTQEFTYLLFQLCFEDITYSENILELGSFIEYNHNSQGNLISNFTVKSNVGSFLVMRPFDTINHGNQLQVTISKSSFIQNYGQDSGIIKAFTNSNLTIRDGSIFESQQSYGRGSIAFIDGQNAVVRFQDCTFQNNSAYLGGLFFTQLEGYVQVLNSLISNSVAFTGGVLYNQNEGYGYFQNVTLTKNFAFQNSLSFSINSGQPISILSSKIFRNGQLFFQDEVISFQSLFYDLALGLPEQILMQKEYYTQLSQRYSALFLSYVLKNWREARELLSNTITNSQLRLIKAQLEIGNDTIIYNQDQLIGSDSQSQILIKSTTIAIVLHGQTYFINCVQSSLEIRSLSVLDSSTASSLIFLQKSQGSLSSIVIEAFEGSFLLAVESQIAVDNFQASSVQQNLANIGFLNIQKSSLTANNVTIFHFSQKDSSQGIFNAEQSSFKFDQLVITNYSTQGIVAKKSYLQISNSKFQNGTELSLQGIGLYLVSSDAYIESSYFQSLQCAFGCAVYASKSSNENLEYILSITNCSFIINKAGNAGAVSLTNYNGIIENSFFLGNQAIDQRAGAIYNSCELQNERCEFALIKNMFDSNSAPLEGGAIFYDLYQPFNFSTNSFENNSAIYGPAIASFPFQLLQVGADLQPLLPYSDGQPSLNINLSDPSNTFSLEFVSGQIYHSPLRIGVFDQDYQLIVKDNQSQGQINSNDQDLSISINSKVQALAGVYYFENLILSYPPGYKTAIQIESEDIDREKHSKIIGKPYQDLEIPIAFRNCMPGEVNQQGVCKTCQKGTYSFGYDSIKCSNCFKHAECIGGNITLIDSGYWRSSSTSSILHKCQNEEACLGGLNSDCKQGYQGKLCNSCVMKIGETFYTKSGDECVECENITLQVLKLLGIIALICVYVVFILTSLLHSPRRNKPQTVLLRILTNYFQAIMIAKDFDLFWPESIKQMLDALSFLSSQNQKAFSLDCLNKQVLGIDINAFYFKILCFAILPIVLSVFAIVAWIFFYFFLRYFPQKKRRIKLQLWQNIEVTIYLIVFICYPIITNIAFSLFSCDKIEDLGYFLKSDYEIECWVGAHRQMSMILGIPIILIWILGFPIYIWIRISFNRDKLDLKEFISRFGLFYIGYTNECFYWEILIVNIRKISFILCSTLLSFLSPQFKACCGIAILLIQAQLLHRLEPYIDPEFTRVEYHSLFSAVSTLYGGLFLMDQSVSQNPQLLALMFVCILIYNLYFYILWTYRFIEVLLRQHVQKLREFMCCYFLRRVQIDTYDYVVKKHQRRHVLFKTFRRRSVRERAQMMSSIKGENIISLEGMENPSPSLSMLKNYQKTSLQKLSVIKGGTAFQQELSSSSSEQSILTEQNMGQDVETTRKPLIQKNEGQQATEIKLLQHRSTNRKNFSISDFQQDKERLIKKNIAKQLRNAISQNKIEESSSKIASNYNNQISDHPRPFSSPVYKQQRKIGKLNIMFKKNEYEKSQTLKQKPSSKEIAHSVSQKQIPLTPVNNLLKGLKLDKEFDIFRINEPSQDVISTNLDKSASHSVIQIQEKGNLQRPTSAQISKITSQQRLDILKAKYSNYKRFNVDDEIKNLDRLKKEQSKGRVEAWQPKIEAQRKSSIKIFVNKEEVGVNADQTSFLQVKIQTHSSEGAQSANNLIPNVPSVTKLPSQLLLPTTLPLEKNKSLIVAPALNFNPTPQWFKVQSEKAHSEEDFSEGLSVIDKHWEKKNHKVMSQFVSQEERTLSDAKSQAFEDRSLSSIKPSDNYEGSNISKANAPSAEKPKFFLQVEQLEPSQPSVSEDAEEILSQSIKKAQLEGIVRQRNANLKISDPEQINRSINLSSARLRRNSTAINPQEQKKREKSEKRIQELKNFDGNLKINFDLLLGAKRMAKRLSSQRSLLSIDLEQEDQVSQQMKSSRKSGVSNEQQIEPFTSQISSIKEDQDKFKSMPNQGLSIQKIPSSSDHTNQLLLPPQKNQNKRQSANLMHLQTTKTVSFKFEQPSPKPKGSSRGLKPDFKDSQYFGDNLQESSTQYLQGLTSGAAIVGEQQASSRSKSGKNNQVSVMERQFSSMLFDKINSNNITNDKRRKRKRSNSLLDDQSQLYHGGLRKKKQQPTLQRSKQINLSSMKLKNL